MLQILIRDFTRILNPNGINWAKLSHRIQAVLFTQSGSGISGPLFLNQILLLRDRRLFSLLLPWTSSPSLLLFPSLHCGSGRMSLSPALPLSLSRQLCLLSLMFGTVLFIWPLLGDRNEERRPAARRKHRSEKEGKWGFFVHIGLKQRDF